MRNGNRFNEAKYMDDAVTAVIAVDRMIRIVWMPRETG